MNKNMRDELCIHKQTAMHAVPPLAVVASGALSCLLLSTDGACLLALLTQTHRACLPALTPLLQLSAPLALAYGLSKFLSPAP